MTRLRAVRPSSLARIARGSILLALVAGAACGSSDGVDATAQVDDLGIVLSETSSKAETFSLVLENSGQQSHHLVVVRSDAPIDEFPVAPDGTLDVDRLPPVFDRIPTLAPGVRARTSITGIQPGTYYLVCTLGAAEGNHARLGVWTTFEITENPDLVDQL